MVRMLETINECGQSSDIFQLSHRVLDLALRSFSLCFAFSVPCYAMKTETKPGTVISLQDTGGGRTSHGYQLHNLSAHMECKLSSEEARKVLNILFLIRNTAMWSN